MSSETTSWWFHVLTRDGAEPIHLEPDTPFRFGRQEDCELRISSRKASRQHAQIEWTGSQAVLVDLGSNNGSYVNEKRITSHPLKDGDEIRIATFLCVYRKVHDLGELEEEVDGGALTTAGANSMFSGHLHKTPLLEVLTTLAHDGDTGQINLLPKKGQIGLRQGEPVWAYAQTSQGEPALLQMLLLEQGMFVFSPSLEERPANINRALNQILASAIEKGVKPPGDGRRMAPRPGRPTRRGPGLPPPMGLDAEGSGERRGPMTRRQARPPEGHGPATGRHPGPPGPPRAGPAGGPVPVPPAGTQRRLPGGPRGAEPAASALPRANDPRASSSGLMRRGPQEGSGEARRPTSGDIPRPSLGESPSRGVPRPPRNSAVIRRGPPQPPPPDKA